MIDEADTIDKRKLIIPQLEGIYRRVAPYGYAFLRWVMALTFIQNGTEKLFFGGIDRIAAGNITKLGLSFPYAWAWTVASLDLIGGILIGLGLFTRPVAVAFVVELIVIAVGIAAPRGFFWTTNGIEITLLMELVFIGFIFGGGGRFSVDRMLGREF